MAESNPDPFKSLSGEDAKAPDVFVRAKEEIKAIMHTHKSNHHHKETHGLRSDIDENTPISDVKAPNVFERAKEEIEALVQTIHQKKEPENHGSHPNGERRYENVTEELKQEKSDYHPGEDAKAPDVFVRAKEEIEAIMHIHKSNHHHKETHGLRSDIDENTPISDVKAPNVFERAKEEIEALVQTIHQKKEPGNHGSHPNGERRYENVTEELKQEKSDSHPGKDVQAQNLIERAKEEFKEIMHKEKSPRRHHHHKESHGMSYDIDENTPINEVKGPSVFERAKEEVEALVQTIHPKKQSRNVVSSPKEEGRGFRMSVGRALEKVCTVCSPRATKRD